jgi:hypothetical protein
MKLVFKITLACSFLIFCISCNDSSNNYIKVATEPSEEILRDTDGVDFSIVLNDMNVTKEGDKQKFQHKYHILKVIKDSLVVDSLDWKTVNRPFFEKHEKDLGMEIVSYHDGQLSRVAQPVGFGWAVGNPKYGTWEEEKTDSTATASTGSNTAGERVWRSNGSGFFFWYWMMRRPAYQSNYSGFRASRGMNKPYYGATSGGNNTYGTNSTYENGKRPSFFNRKNNSTSWKSHTKQKASRSSSRYSNGSSTRARSGGIGK